LQHDVFHVFEIKKMYELKYAILIEVHFGIDLSPMTNGIPNSSHYCNSYTFEKLQNHHVFEFYGIVFKDNNIYMLK